MYFLLLTGGGMVYMSAPPLRDSFPFLIPCLPQWSPSVFLVYVLSCGLDGVCACEDGVYVCEDGVCACEECACEECACEECACED